MGFLSEIIKWINNNGIVASIGSVFTTALILVLTKSVDEIFEKRKEKRLKIEGIMGKVIDEVSSATGSTYKNYPTGKIKDRLMKSATHLERLGNKKRAETIRSFVNKWVEYNNLAVSTTGSLKNLFGDDADRARGLIKELDNLTNKLIN